MKKFLFTIFITSLICQLPVQVKGEDYQKWGELTNKAVMYFKAGYYEEALKLTKESLALAGREDDPLSLANLAAIYKVTGDEKSAMNIIKNLKDERIKLEKDLEKQEKEYKKMKKDAGITSGTLPLGPVSEKAFDLFGLRKSINFYMMYERNATEGKVVHSLYGASYEAYYVPKENIIKEYYKSGELWKEYTYKDDTLIGMKEFDNTGNLIFSGSIY